MGLCRPAFSRRLCRIGRLVFDIAFGLERLPAFPAENGLAVHGHGKFILIITKGTEKPETTVRDPEVYLPEVGVEMGMDGPVFPYRIRNHFHTAAAFTFQFPGRAGRTLPSAAYIAGKIDTGPPGLVLYVGRHPTLSLGPFLKGKNRSPDLDLVAVEQPFPGHRQAVDKGLLPADILNGNASRLEVNEGVPRFDFHVLEQVYVALRRTADGGGISI